MTKIPKDQGLRDIEHPFQKVFPLQTRETCNSCHTGGRCVSSGGKSWGTLRLQPLAVTVSWNAAPFAQKRQWEGVSLFAWTGVNSVLPWFCFSVTPVLVNPILLLTDIFLNATVTIRTKGEYSEMFLEAGCKGQVNGYLCANRLWPTWCSQSSAEHGYHLLTQHRMAQHRDDLE